MTKVHSRRFGRPGGHPAVLAHCFLGHAASWARLVEALPVPLDALAFDMPGHGQSPMPADPGDFHAMVAGLITGLVTRPSLLIGHSFGAASMLRHALHHPETVTGLVLVEPVFLAAAAAEPEFATYRADEARMQAAGAQGGGAGAARAFLAMNPGSPDFDTLPTAAQAIMAAQMRLVGAADAGVHGDSGGLMAPGLMDRFDKPVLLVAGESTAPIFPAIIRALARRLPKAEAVVIPGAGHMVPISHPQATAAAIHDWMQRSGQLAGPEPLVAPEPVAPEPLVVDVTENPRAG